MQSSEKLNSWAVRVFLPYSNGKGFITLACFGSGLSLEELKMVTIEKIRLKLGIRKMRLFFLVFSILCPPPFFSSFFSLCSFVSLCSKSSFKKYLKHFFTFKKYILQTCLSNFSPYSMDVEMVRISSPPPPIFLLN